MKSRKTSVARLVAHDEVKRLALPSNLRYGRAIYKRGGVEFIKYTAAKVEGWVGGLDGSSAEGGGQRRRARLSSTVKGLAWHCAGNPKDHQIFCKHCVALAMAIGNRSRSSKK
jgi:hypothetical protein